MPEPSAISQDIAAISNIGAVPAILKVVAELTGMRVSLVARVTADNWTTCAVYDKMGFGLQVGDQLEVVTTLCKEVHDTRKAIIIESASSDLRYCEHHTPKLYKIESYIALPIMRPNGEVFGTLCAIDRKPAKLDAKIIASLNLFTELIARQLMDEDEHQRVRQALWDERSISQLREQFIAVLGHDLRTPLGGIMGSADALFEEATDPGQMEMLNGIKESATQMSDMINDVLDFARGRLGGGVTLVKTAFSDTAQLVRRAIEELSHAHHSRTVEFLPTKAVPAVVDDTRFRQLLSNLIGNALQHSPSHGKVTVKLEEVGGMLRFSVRNIGSVLPPEVLQNLFAPFQRGQSNKKRSGLGLGLYIAAEIARAHGGSIHGESDESGTVFTVLLPQTTANEAGG